MHQFVIVFVKPENASKTGIGAAMAPFCKPSPIGQWDWYRIGGRWDGAIRGLDPLPETDFTTHFGEAFETIGRNSIPAGELKDIDCFSYLTESGDWYNKDSWNGKRFVKDEAFEANLAAYIKANPGLIAFGVDCHT
jgi:hypothetical protein